MVFYSALTAEEIGARLAERTIAFRRVVWKEPDDGVVCRMEADNQFLLTATANGLLPANKAACTVTMEPQEEGTALHVRRGIGRPRLSDCLIMLGLISVLALLYFTYENPIDFWRPLIIVFALNFLFFIFLRRTRREQKSRLFAFIEENLLG